VGRPGWCFERGVGAAGFYKNLGKGFEEGARCSTEAGMGKISTLALRVMIGEGAGPVRLKESTKAARFY